MSKTAQRNQSAFDVGQRIGRRIARDLGKTDTRAFSARFENLYKGKKNLQGIVYRAARIGYLNELEKAASAAQVLFYHDKLTGGKDAKL